MNPKVIMAATLFVFVMAVFLTTFVSPAHAAKGGGLQASAEPETGLGSVFKKRAATGIGPTRTQLGITIGATIVMFACLKFL